MRSQKEILDKIESIRASKTDQMKYMRTHLIRKLTIENARQFLKQQYWFDEAFLNAWRKASRLDEEYLISEIRDYLFKCYELWLQKNPMGSFVAAQHLLIWCWLLGPKHDDLFRRVFHLFTYSNSNFNLPIYDTIVKHFGWKRETYLRDWEERGEQRGSGLILPEKNIKNLDREDTQ